jgi:catechol 2,3-dioxygenase-like lactoylglutathione lyase family enzyme
MSTSGMKESGKETGILGIDALIYSSDGTKANWDAARQFFNDWGLKELAVSDAEQCFETLSGAQVIVRLPDDARLSPAMEPGATLREVVWAVESQSALNLLYKSASSPYQLCAECYQENSKTDLQAFSVLDPHGLQQTFRVSQQRRIQVQGSPTNPYGAPQRINAPSPVYERATPVEIGHVVLFTDRLKEAVAFYEALGFVMSDSYPGRGAFLRCSATAGHHDVFLLQLPPDASGKSKVGLNHIAFTVRDIHEVFGGGLAMSRAGWKTQLGPGRHPISSAYFWYFECPVGGLIEYNADEDHLTADWQPREFQPGPTVFAEWAIDGGIDGHTRRQPKVEAGGQFLTEKRH